ncbi:MAG TPA: hypothetical protein VNL91_04235 [Thermoanaerobaculia bacterium]|nr:hypothetical protein [Thermoanaerobaculia bacterium]
MTCRDCNREIEWFAAFVHVILGAFHFLAFIFNWRRAKRVDRDASIHLGVCIFDLWSARKHARRLRTAQEETR